MPFTSLSGRLDRLPLVLAGPMVRRVEPREVTVWLALRQPRKVTLRVYDGDRDGRGQTVRLSGTRSTVAVGENLHVVAVTADKVSGDPLQPERIFSYDLFLSSAGHGADAVDVLETSARCTDAADIRDAAARAN